MSRGLHSDGRKGRFTWALTGLNLLLATACGGELPPEEEVQVSSQSSHLDSCSPDVTPPTVMCQPEGGLVECVAYGYVSEPSELVYFSDNCGIVWSNWSLGVTVPGTTSSGLSMSDAAGNSAGCSTAWKVVDSHPPRLTLNGDAQVVLPYGTRYVDPGAYADDSCVGSTVNVQRTGDYIPFVPGIYPVTYSASDMAGNVSQRTRLVTVLPETDCTAQLAAPVIALQGRSEETVECGHDTWTEPGSMASDACGAVAVHTYNSGQDPYGPGPNSKAEGYYTVQYLAWNGQGTTSAARTVTVRDTRPPTLRLKGPMRMTHTCGSNWVDPGTTATDECYGDVSYSVQTTGSVNGWAAGTYTVTYQARDPGGHLSNIQKRVVDVVNCPW